MRSDQAIEIAPPDSDLARNSPIGVCRRIVIRVDVDQSDQRVEQFVVARIVAALARADAQFGQGDGGDRKAARKILSHLVAQILASRPRRSEEHTSELPSLMRI